MADRRPLNATQNPVGATTGEPRIEEHAEGHNASVLVSGMQVQGLSAGKYLTRI